MADGDFTLEKQRISERLQSVEGAIERAAAVRTEMDKRILGMLEHHEHLLMGNGKPGLVLDVDRLKQRSKERTTQLKWVWSAIAVALSPHGWDLLAKAFGK